MGKFNETKRQTFHALFVTLFLILIYKGIMNITHFIILLFLGGILSIIYKKHPIPGIKWWMTHFEREDYTRQFPGKGALSVVLGVTITLALFGNYPQIVAAALAILALGDSTATVIGRLGGKKHPLNSKKVLRGSIAGTIAGYIGAICIPGITPQQAAIASIFAMIFEAKEIKYIFKLDDNISVPVSAGIVLYLMIVIF